MADTLIIIPFTSSPIRSVRRRMTWPTPSPHGCCCYLRASRYFYDEIVRDVIDGYWRDYQDHQANFMPAFLANDILRIWRTFCVNYEARTKREPDDKKASGKLKNYKLKHSRLLTCYSALWPAPGLNDTRL